MITETELSTVRRRKKMLGNLTIEQVIAVITAATSDADNTLVYDTFTDANGTLLANHTPDIDVVGGGYVNYRITGTPLDSDHSIQNNELVIDTPESGIVIDTSKSNVDISVDMYTGVSNVIKLSVLARYTDANNLFFLACRAPEADARIVSRESGTITQRAIQSSVVYPADTYITVRAELSGNTIRFYSDGLFDLSYTSSFNNTATFAGLTKNSFTGDGIFDNFRARSL